MTAGLLLIGGVPCTVLATHSMSFLGLSPVFAGTRAFLAHARGSFARAVRALPEPE